MIFILLICAYFLLLFCFTDPKAIYQSDTLNGCVNKEF